VDRLWAAKFRFFTLKVTYFLFMKQDSGEMSSHHLVAFTEKRTIEMADYTCRVHGGHLPVPKNAYENKVKINFNFVWNLQETFYGYSACG